MKHPFSDDHRFRKYNQINPFYTSYLKGFIKTELESNFENIIAYLVFLCHPCSKRM